MTGENITIIAIDGRCGSGKTTLAALLQELFNCTVFHMDDFFLRKEQRTSERINTPGEFVDYERFIEEVLIPIRENRDVFLRKFCHETFEPGDPQKVEITPVVIVEGSYSCNSKLKDYYDKTIFVTTDKETQLNRIHKRNPEKYEMFVEKWIPLEEMYFEAFCVEDSCDYVYRT